VSRGTVTVEFLQLLCAIGTVALALYGIGRRRGAARAALPSSVAGTCEWVGLTVVVYLALVAVGMAITLAFRAAGMFTSMYGNTDLALIGVAAVLAHLYRTWSLPAR
jgi:hypothetical protein